MSRGFDYLKYFEYLFIGFRFNFHFNFHVDFYLKQIFRKVNRVLKLTTLEKRCQSFGNKNKKNNFLKSRSKG